LIRAGDVAQELGIKIGGKDIRHDYVGKGIEVYFGVLNAIDDVLDGAGDGSLRGAGSGRDLSRGAQAVPFAGNSGVVRRCSWR
jgi:hypothetical protein